MFFCRSSLTILVLTCVQWQHALIKRVVDMIIRSLYIIIQIWLSVTGWGENARGAYLRGTISSSGILRQRPLGNISYGWRKQEVSSGICETTHRYVATSVSKRSSSDVWGNPEISVCHAARALSLPRCMVHRILRRNNLRPFHYQLCVQQLLERDETPRIFVKVFTYSFYSIIKRFFAEIKYQ